MCANVSVFVGNIHYFSYLWGEAASDLGVAWFYAPVAFSRWQKGEEKVCVCVYVWAGWLVSLIMLWDFPLQPVMKISHSHSRSVPVNFWQGQFPGLVLYSTVKSTNSFTVMQTMSIHILWCGDDIWAKPQFLFQSLWDTPQTAVLSAVDFQSWWWK